MSDLRVNSINSMDIMQLRRVLSSEQLTDNEKAQFIRKNSVEIKQLVQGKITEKELAGIMQNRPLIRFRPLKNSFTKRGDKILLAKSLEIEPSEVDSYVQKMVTIVNTTNDIKFISNDNLEKVKTYVYRHGSKEQVVSFLEYELSDVKNILRKLYKTLEYNSGGLADYFSRPIHRMDNRTMAKLYNTIDKSLKKANKSGIIDDTELNSTSEWALFKIYEVQNNSKLVRAVKAYKTLK